MFSFSGLFGFGNTDNNRGRYPNVRRDEDIIDDFHGTLIPDPYRWLESSNDPELKQFITDQNKTTDKYLQEYLFRKKVSNKFLVVSDYKKYFCPTRKGHRYFFYVNSGLQDQHVLFVQERINGEARELLNPNYAIPDPKDSSIDQVGISDDGQFLAYALSKSGSDWSTIYFKRVRPEKKSKKSKVKEFPIKESLTGVKFSMISWTKDAKGIFYSRYPVAPSEPVKKTGIFSFFKRSKGTPRRNTLEDIDLHVNHKLYYHQLGTPQSEDVIAVEFPDHPDWRIKAQVSSCGQYLVVCPEAKVRNNMVFISKLVEGSQYMNLELMPIITEFQCDYDYVTNEGPLFYFRTNKNSPNYCIISIDVNHPLENNWKTLIHQYSKDVLLWATCVHNDKLIVCYLRNVKHVIQLRNLENGTLIYEYPFTDGTIAQFTGDKRYEDFFFYYTSFLTPGQIYYVNLKKTGIEFCRLMYDTVVPELKLNDYTVTQDFYSSKDGTQIPMFIIHKNNVKKTGKNPCLLYGYGGFGVNESPIFSIFRFVFMNYMRGVVAIPNIRGGGEFGENWHNGGRLFNKQNSFDDFAAAAQYLAEKKYTRPGLLAIHGGSNGGMLVTVCANQHPELISCAISQVGVHDLLRYHKFTIGAAWTTDYGVSDSPDHFENLIKFSPLHNVRKLPEEGPVEQYPAILLCTGDHDDRVVPLHSYKYISELQHQFGDEPNQRKALLLRVEAKSGHGKGKTVKKRLSEYSDMLCFLIRSIDDLPLRLNFDASDDEEEEEETDVNNQGSSK